MIIPARYFGDTRSGRRVCAYQTEDETYIKQQITDFSVHDHFDAHCLFQWLMVDALRKYGDMSSELKDFTFMSAIHSYFLTPKFWAAEKEALSLVTSIDIATHGKSLIKRFFIE